MTRSEAYQRLAEQLNMKPADCHIAFFNKDTCKAVKAVCDQRFFKELLDL